MIVVSSSLSIDDHICSRDVTVHACSPLLCAITACPAYPDAHCRINPCTAKCEVEYYDDDNNNVDCMKGERFDTFQLLLRPPSRLFFTGVCLSLSICLLATLLRNLSYKLILTKFSAIVSCTCIITKLSWKFHQNSFIISQILQNIRIFRIKHTVLRIALIMN